METMKNKIWFPLIVAIFISSSLIADVKGQFKVDGKTVITPTHAAAYPVRDQFNPREMQIEVILAEGPVDTKALTEALDPHVDVINQDPVRAGNYVLLWIDPKGRVDMNGTLSETMTQYADTTHEGGLKAELTTNTKDRIAGRVYTPTPVKTLGGETYEVDVTFDVAVSRAPTGTKLPGDGGDPGKAFQALYQAVQKKDMNGIKAGVTPEVENLLFEDYYTPEENLKSAVDTLTAWLPKKNVKVTGGELRSNTAIVEVEGEIYEGRNALYLVKMVKTDSGWSLQQAAPAGMFPK